MWANRPVPTSATSSDEGAMALFSFGTLATTIDP